MLAIIPARGGSKGIPGKNIKMLCAKPLIAYTIEAALAAKSIDRVIVSTDDEAIADVARRYGAQVPFMRPSALAQDNSLAIDNYIYTVDRLNNEFNGGYKDYAVLQPTVPLRTAEDIDHCVELFNTKNADSVVSCNAMHHPLGWVFQVNQDGVIERNIDINVKEMMNRQESRVHYIPNGAVYVFKHALLKEKYSYYSNKTYAYIMPQERSVDIDVEFDLNFAAFLIEQGRLNA